MKQPDLLQLLDDLFSLPHETEWVEFKEAKDQYNFNKLGRYFSALSNEANLGNQLCGWLVFGVVDKGHSVCGSHFRENPTDLNNLKQEVATQTTGGVTFMDIYVVDHPDGRIVMFKISPAPKGVPIAWKGHWYGRDGESVGALNLQELERIRGQNFTGLSGSRKGYKRLNGHRFICTLDSESLFKRQRRVNLWPRLRLSENH